MEHLRVIFQSSRGLRQGNLLSPYHFVIAMEALNCLLKKAICGGFLSACQVKGRGREGVEVSHLLFADDTLIFCEAGEEQMTFLCWVLMWFEAISGLKVNLDKSELILVGRVENVDDLVGKLGCKVGRLSSTYLGMPLGASFNSVAAWDGIKERFRKREKYGEDRGGWLTREAREGHGVGFWKAIRNLGHLVSSRFSFVVGNGQWVSFWKDKWCGNSLLCNSFPSLYVLTANKEAWVSDLWAGSASGDLGGSWNPRFTRHFNNWELYEVEGLLRRLCEERVMLDEDTVRWSMSNDGNFLVKSLYKVLELDSLVCFPVKIIWNHWVQPKISFVAWAASWRKVLTLDQIQKKGWAITNDVFLCQDYEESIDHLLLHCEKTREVWNLFFTCLECVGCFLPRLGKTLVVWDGAWVGKKRRTV
ncbi:hypothetical protein CK203_027274 [Vitis vinifera]|uniref:Reverse transcriptase domain-containing protein n=1 Tax=Vitis vinifera TaxID=29760 RepID=A0A438J9M1_VITVI|nr:hypothetical protein CK203_027274 [Vitis vinifera]